jgi:hypothetical protein
MSPSLLVEWTIKSVVIVLMMLAGFAYLTLFERRVLARMQVRIGPNRAGPWGLLQPVADGIKLIFKEELIPAQADRLLFVLAPIVTVIPALILLAVIPIGPSITIGGRQISLGLADDVNVGVLYLSAVTSIARPADAARIGVMEGGQVEVRCSGRVVSLAVRVREEVPAGIGLVPRSAGVPMEGPVSVEVRPLGRGS